MIKSFRCVSLSEINLFSQKKKNDVFTNYLIKYNNVMHKVQCKMFILHTLSLQRYDNQIFSYIHIYRSK